MVQRELMSNSKAALFVLLQAHVDDKAALHPSCPMERRANDIAVYF
jgi:hypothetical protein